MPMITMYSDWWNADFYYPWIDPLVQAAFGAEIDLHGDLYLQPLRDPTDDPAAALLRARDRYRGAVTGLLSAAQDRGHQEPS